MRVSSVTFGFTKSVPGYQSQRADCTIEVQEGESADRAMELAAAFVFESLDMPHNDQLLRNWRAGWPQGGLTS